jgi:secondary thiamine-phosphate synthase enzyme
MVKRLSVRISGQGLHDVTRQVAEAVRESGVREGLCTVFLQHTSASLTIQENADPSARRDLHPYPGRA